MSRVLVVGLGNSLRSDDAAGPVVARQLGNDPRVLVYEGEPIGLIEAWSGADEVLIVDAVSSGAVPGTMHRLDAVAAPLPSDLACGSTHAFGLRGTIELARALERLPARLLIYGIEGKRFTAGSELSPPVDEAVDEVSRELSARLDTRDRSRPGYHG
jgi:hydrogenase maturation protease